MVPILYQTNTYKCDFINVFGPIVWTFTLDIGNIRLACNESEYSGLKSLVVKDNQSSESRLSSKEAIVVLDPHILPISSRLVCTFTMHSGNKGVKSKVEFFSEKATKFEIIFHLIPMFTL